MHNWQIKSIRSAKDQNWRKTVFVAKDELFFQQRKVSVPYYGQNYDPKEALIRKRGWDHDHCLSCGLKISEDSKLGIQEAYENDHHDWLCPTCFLEFGEFNEKNNV